MTWIADAERRTLAMQERAEKIRNEASTIYNALWQELLKNVAEAKKIERFKTLDTNGNPEARIIQMSVMPAPGEDHADPRIVCIKLLSDIQHIRATGGGVSVTLAIDVCDDGFVCLKLENERIEYADAAMAILYPFLYPGLLLPDKASNYVG